MPRHEEEIQKLLQYMTEEEKQEWYAALTANEKPSYLQWYNSVAAEGMEAPKHIEWICNNVAQPLIDGEYNRVILSMPPQHSKSFSLTHRLPVYWGEQFPGDNILLTGYSQEFAETNLSFWARQIAHERKILAPNAKALNSWKLRTGGTVNVRGVGAPPTGLPKLKLIIADDPIKSREDANSEVERNRIWDWWRGTIVQRFWPGTRVLLIMTRWHEDDLVGRLLKDQADNWTVINLPALAESNDPMGRAKGEALWPDQKPRDFLLQQKREMGAYEFEALFQGNPTPREGSFFKVDNIGFVDYPPENMKVVRSWDVAATEGAGDYTASVKMGYANGNWYILHAMRGQWSTDTRDQKMRETAEADGTGVKITIPADNSAGGKSMTKAFVRLLQGYSVTPIGSKNKNKEQRADPFSSQLNAGNVKFVKGRWNDMLIEELRSFPGGKHDDMTDCCSDAFSQMVQNTTIASTVQTTMGDIMVPLNLPGMGSQSMVRAPQTGGTLDRMGRLKSARRIETLRIY